MAVFTRQGFGQIEPNQLSAQVTAEVYASLPLKSDVMILQNGEFMKYDYPNKEVNTTGKGEWMLVYNEVKLYDMPYRHSYKDFAMIRVGDNYVTEGSVTQTYKGTAAGATVDPAHTEYGYRMDGIVPRLFKTNIGDIYTTNMVKLGEEYVEGDILAPSETETEWTDTDGTTKTYTTGVLQKSAEGAQGMLWQVAKVYTMPDGQPGLKLMRIQ